MWSVSHAHGFVTPSEFVHARFGSRGLAALVAIVGLAATMPYIAVQLIALQALLKTIGITGDWPLVVAMAVASICTFQSGLRAPALLSIAKEVLLAWLVLSLLVLIAAAGGLRRAFDAAQTRFAADASPATGLLLPEGGHLNYLTLIVGSALAIFAYPHAVTAILAAKDRGTVKRNAAALPLYTLVLGLLATGLFLLHQLPQRAPDGRVLKAHFGSSSLPLAELGVPTTGAVYVGVVALAVNLVVVVAATVLLRSLRIPSGVDRTRPADYLADADDPALPRLDQLVDGLRQRGGVHARQR